MPSFIPLLDFIGIAAFAATGALVATRHHMDVFGALTLAFVTGIGGGTIRDLILDAPVFWLDQPHALWACLVGFAAVYVTHRFRGATPALTVNLLDAVGLAVFSVLGAAKAIALGHSPAIAVVMGFLTGCGGGMLRDVLANDVPFVMSREHLYATPSLLGALVFVAAQEWSMPLAVGMGFVVTLGIRLASLFFNWRLPFFPEARR